MSDDLLRATCPAEHLEAFDALVEYRKCLAHKRPWTDHALMQMVRINRILVSLSIAQRSEVAA